MSIVRHWSVPSSIYNQKASRTGAVKHFFLAEPSDPAAERFYLSDLNELALSRFPFDAHQPIEVHTLGFEPGFESFPGILAKLREHFSLKHIDHNAFGFGHITCLHAEHQRLGAL